ncbi:MAG: hypothetical protein K2G77_02900 [Muribaculaceae bacterium]|nr:hypothetical protein [Muribaculaceae bacterium]
MLIQILDMNGEGNCVVNSLISETIEIGKVSAELTATSTFPTANLRIPLEPGDKEKVIMLLNGEISRVDPATADRLTNAILQKAAESLLDISTDLRRQGLFILPFRFFTMRMTSEGSLSYPSPQAIALPTDFPPHPEITAYSVTDDALTLAIRFPARPHRLVITPGDNFPSDHTLRTFISYPLYIPDPKELRGSLGSVRSATGGNAVGIRFAFLSLSAIKASVAAPEKYYEMVGNPKTGYRISSKSTSLPDYSCYASIYHHVQPFPRDSMLALGNDVAADTDPMDWIADWREAEGGYLPMSLPHKYHTPGNESTETAYPVGIDKEEISDLAGSLNLPYSLLTQPMALTADSKSLRKAEQRAIRKMRVHGMSDSPALAILYGSDDHTHWEQIRRFDPRFPALLLTPKRFWWRLLLLTKHPATYLAIEIE